MAKGKQPTPLLDATNEAIKAAKHLDPKGMDAGSVAAIRALALKIDVMDLYFQELTDSHRERNLRPPSQDNVSIPTYLKYATAMGLVPSGRLSLPSKPEARKPAPKDTKPAAKKGGGLASVSNIPRPTG